MHIQECVDCFVFFIRKQSVLGSQSAPDTGGQADCLLETTQVQPWYGEKKQSM